MSHARHTRHMPASLRTPSNATPLLRASFAQKCTAVELAAGMRAAAVASETARLKPEGSPPAGDPTWVGASEWRERWGACENHAERLEVLREMDQQLGVQAIDRSRVRGTLEWKLRVAKDPRASAVVAAEVGCSPSRVRQLRMQYVAGELYEKR